MPPFRSLARISARLLAAGPPQAGPPGPRHRFRLLVIGPAVLVREEPGPWRVTAGGGNALRPVVAGLGAGAVGRPSTVRVAAARAFERLVARLKRSEDDTKETAVPTRDR